MMLADLVQQNPSKATSWKNGNDGVLPGSCRP
jgi:hypothetical protein